MENNILDKHYIPYLGHPARKMFLSFWVKVCGVIPSPTRSFKKWLRGEFVCCGCGKQMHLVSFGYGETICPRCYDGEDEFIFPDKSYWLNRLLFNKC